MPVTERKVSLLATGGHKKNDPNRRYTIIKQDGSETERPRFPTSPYAARAPKFCNDSISDAVSLSQSPKVMSHKDLPQKEMGFKMYDVILSGEGDAPAPTFDPEMEKFMPMLTDYLKSEDWCVSSCGVREFNTYKVHDISPPGSPSTAKPAAESSVSISKSKSQGDDYVWDVFYHRPTNLGEWNAIANIGTLCVHFIYFCLDGFCWVSCFLNLVG
jgi:hypothetical protein